MTSEDRWNANGEPRLSRIWKYSPGTGKPLLLATPRMGITRTPEKVRRILSDHEIECEVEFVPMDRYHQGYDYCLMLLDKFAMHVYREGKYSTWAESTRKNLIINCGIKINY